MEEQNWLQAMQMQTQLQKVMETNQYTQQYGLSLSPEDAQILVAERTNTLREQKRVEFGSSILPAIIYEFCDSDYLEYEDYSYTTPSGETVVAIAKFGYDG